MPVTPVSRTPSTRRADAAADDAASCSCRSPKRARASPSPRDAPRQPSSAGSSSSSRSNHTGISRRPKHGAPLDYGDALAPPHHTQHHAATSPCRSPPPSSQPWGRTAGRRREMSVPLLSQSLSHVSLSQSTPPCSSEVSPDAMTRTLASSTPPAVGTPETVVDVAAGTPRRLPTLRRMHTPAPLATREVHTAPIPALNSLLGSPFSSKAKLYPYELTSPTWIAKGSGADEPMPPSWTAEWMEDKDVIPQLHPSGSNSPAAGEKSGGSCTSASSMYSSERLVNAAHLRPSVVSIWGEDATFNDHAPTPNRQLFAAKSPKVNDAILLSTRLLQSSPGQPSPLMGKRVLPSPNGIGGEYSPQMLTRQNLEPTSPAGECGHALPSMARLAASTSSKSNDDGFLPLPHSRNPLLRRTSEPTTKSADDAYAIFLARCGGDRATRSDMASHEPSTDPSSEPNELDLEFSPLRSVANRTTIAPIPPRPTGLPPSPSAPFNAIKGRLQRLKHSPKTKTTPGRGSKGAVRPPLRRGATDPQPLQFGTPVSQLFGDDKPSPAAFASAGLVKKRGGRFSLPFQKQKARVQTPLPKPSPADKSALANSISGPVMPIARTSGMLRDHDAREVLAPADADAELEDTDEDDVSPIRPMRSAQFRRSLGSGHHRRMSSTTSDITTSPAYRRSNKGHNRMSSTASSIGGSRGLRRKGSTMFNSGMASDSEKPSPATPTKALPFASIQPKFGIATPSPTVAASQYPFARRASTASIASITSIDMQSPTASPFPPTAGRMRALSRAGPVHRASNPMLAAAFRAHAVPPPTTPTLESTIGEQFMPDAVRAAGAGRFERDFALILALGYGEFSQVFKVRSKVDGELWAVKTGRPYTGHKNRLRQLEEVSILRQLGKHQHANIVRLVDSWEQAGRLYIQTELAEYGDLAKYLASIGDIGGLDEGRVWKMMVELTSALDHIHSNGVLHLDFKPSNVLITREGGLKVADFGLSVFAESPEVASTARGREAALARADRDLEGDREYLCPEALLDAVPGPPADIFSLGILVLEAALNVVLPSNGDAWIKLRNNDFSDLDDHYVLREGAGAGLGLVVDAGAWGVPGESPVPVVSAGLLGTIQGMMEAEPRARLTLAEITARTPMCRARAAMAGHGAWHAAPALAEEEPGWTEFVLGLD